MSVRRILKPLRNFKSIRVFVFTLSIAFLLVAIYSIQYNPRKNSGSRFFDQIGCKIFSPEGKILRSFAGDFCVFLPDGSYVTTQYGIVTRFSKFGRRIWRQRIDVHHQMKLSANGNEILFLSDIFSPRGKTFSSKYESFVVMNLNGDQIRRFDTSENEGEIESLSLNKGLALTYTQNEYNAITWEYSHANSIYEIPNNPSAKRLSAFAEGNYILDLNLKGIVVIVDHAMKHILWHKKIDTMGQTHDAQVLPSGDILIYLNVSDINKNSSLVILDPFSDQIIWSYKARPPKVFSSKYQGGVQLLSDGTFLFSDITEWAGAAIQINRQGDELMRYWNNDIDPKSGKPAPFQEVKRLDLFDFLKNNQT